MLKIDIIPALEDNYIYALTDEETGTLAVVDPGEAEPVIEYCDRHSVEPDIIINTHHHWDHTNGNLKLKDRYGAKLWAPQTDSPKIKGIDRTLNDGDEVKIGSETGHIISTPGHTLGGISLHFPASIAVFTGDTLFSMGCGRIFEGTPKQMWESMCKLRALPDNTQIYCGHEYTEKNGTFCMTIEPENQALKQRMEGVERLRRNNRPTIPSLMGIEKRTNVFLRADQPHIMKMYGTDEPAKAFAEIRKAKDSF